MKNWNAPVIEELNLTETKSGWWASDHEGGWGPLGVHDANDKGTTDSPVSAS